MNKMKYAGFWKRVVAYIIDALVLSVVFYATLSIFGSPIIYYDLSIHQSITYYHPLWYLGSVFLAWFYNAFMESSKWQGSLGKLCLNLQVVDLEGNRISFLRATGRHFSKVLSSIILMVGFMMAGWTKKKQALHDKIVDTLVVQK